MLMPDPACASPVIPPVGNANVRPRWGTHEKPQEEGCSQILPSHPQPPPGGLKPPILVLVQVSNRWTKGQAHRWVSLATGRGKGVWPTERATSHHGTGTRGFFLVHFERHFLVGILYKRIVADANLTRL